MLNRQFLPVPAADPAAPLCPQALQVAELLADDSWIHHRVETIAFERDYVVREDAPYRMLITAGAVLLIGSSVAIQRI